MTVFSLSHLVMLKHVGFCRPDNDFQEFCLQVLFECVSKDRPALLQVINYTHYTFQTPNLEVISFINLSSLQVYLSLYTTVGSMVDEITSDSCSSDDTLSLASLKVPSCNPLVQRIFLLRAQVILDKSYL